MTAEHDSIVDGRVYEHEKRISALETKMSNLEAERSRTASKGLVFISAAVTVAVTLLNIWVTQGGKP